jgi:hypothetical protein
MFEVLPPEPEEQETSGASPGPDDAHDAGATPPEEQKEPGSQESKESVPQAPVLVDETGGLLPQTDEKPSAESPHFERGARLLFEAIVADDAELAMPFFFPQAAYEQVKDIPDPARDWERRLKAAYQKDLHKYHRSLGKFRGEARFEKVRVEDSLAKWVKPGTEVNKVGYYRVMRSVLVYRDHIDRPRELGIITMISWRGEWYVVHLAPFK